MWLKSIGKVLTVAKSEDVLSKSIGELSYTPDKEWMIQYHPILLFQIFPEI